MAEEAESFPARVTLYTTKENHMALRVNDLVPNLSLTTDQGNFTMHDFIGDSWTILFSHPKDFTPVCTTEF